MDPWAWLDDPDPGLVDEFWAAVVETGTPLCRRVSGDPGMREVALLWRTDAAGGDRPSPESTGSGATGPRQSGSGRPGPGEPGCDRSSAEPEGVYFRVNRVTDKQQVPRGLASRVSGTPVWVLRLELPARLLASYQVVPLPPGVGGDELASLGGRGADLPAFLDPWNPRRLPGRGGTELSLLRLDEAPDDSCWESPGGLRGSLVHKNSPGSGRPVWEYLPPLTDQPVGLLVLTDAEVWFGSLKVAEVLESLCRQGILPPLAIFGVGNQNNADRVSTLSANPQFLAWLENAAASFAESHPEVAWAGRRDRVICGQSLGGLTALLAACQMPGFFGAALAQSPSMWWHPDGRTPADLVRTETPWITEQLLAAEPEVRLAVSVGTLEGRMVTHAERMITELWAHGWKASLTEYAGGHDFAWWRCALIDGLTEVLGHRTGGRASAMR